MILGSGTDAGSHRPGHFMELAGKQFFSKTDSDNLFLTGAFSLLDTLLGSAMPAILEEMHLPTAVSDALLRGEGVTPPFLKLARGVRSLIRRPWSSRPKSSRSHSTRSTRRCYRR